MAGVKIFKYSIPLRRGLHSVEMPLNQKILSHLIQEDEFGPEFVMYCMGVPSTGPRNFQVAYTGDSIQPGWEFVGTETKRGHVYHIFEIV